MSMMAVSIVEPTGLTLMTLFSPFSAELFVDFMVAAIGLMGGREGGVHKLLSLS